MNKNKQVFEAYFCTLVKTTSKKCKNFRNLNITFPLDEDLSFVALSDAFCSAL